MSKHARYHARRRLRLLTRLGGFCPCGSRERLHVDHVNGDGGLRRAERGSAGEITRLLALPDEELHAQVQLLCEPCHEAKSYARGDFAWA